MSEKYVEGILTPKKKKSQSKQGLKIIFLIGIFKKKSLIIIKLVSFFLSTFTFEQSICSNWGKHDMIAHMRKLKNIYC